MPARTSPPPAPRRLPRLALGSGVWLASCSSWLEVPDEPAIVAGAPPASTVPAAPPPWHPPLEGSRYFGQRDPPEEQERPPTSVPPDSAAAPAVPPVAQSSAVDRVRDAGMLVTPGDPPAADAGVASPAEPGHVDAASEPPGCAGVEVFGICWYLGAQGESCEQTCAERGGPDGAASVHVGTASQGGSREDCVLILNALGQRYRVRSTEHEQGVGCHLPAGDEDPHWLTHPPFTASAYLRNASIACGCND